MKLPSRIRHLRPARHGACAIFAAAVLALAICAALKAQAAQSSATPKISVDTRLVNVLATVRDKHGAIVKNLTKDDFAVEEDGHPQAITYFVQETDLPLTLGLLVDTSMSQSRVLGDERDASRTFIDHVVREDRDKAFLIHFDREVELLQDLTSSRQKLDSALDLLSSPQLQRRDDNGSETGGSGGGNGGGGNGGGGYGRRGRRGGSDGAGTQLYDAIFLACNELMQKQQGRKALVVLTDGVDRGSKETLEDAVESAQRADTLVYSILFSGQEERSASSGPRWSMGGPMGGGPMGGGGGRRRYPQQQQEQRPDGKKVLQRISSETGAQMFEVSKKQTVDQIYASIEDELRNEYSIGYVPPPSDTAGFHTIHVTTKQKDNAVQARSGYYSEPAKPAASGAPASNAAPQPSSPVSH